MPDYSICYRKWWRAEDAWPTDSWDVLISAFNSSDRVQFVFEKAMARQKHWFISPEYRYARTELPANGRCFVLPDADEATVVGTYFSDAKLDLTNLRICIDITGFMRPHLLVILKHLVMNGVRRFDALYTEPRDYVNKENTKFSDEVVVDVRQIAGFEGNHIPDTQHDILIIGAGYDHALIQHVAEWKEDARKLQVLGLPSLRADMYQENVLRVQRASEQLGRSGTGTVDTFFAPANDPFVTANVLAEIYDYAGRAGRVTNMYLCPVSTKVSVLGFGLYYLTEWTGKNASIIFPFCRTYTRETSKGMSRIWSYRVELLH